MKDKYLIYCRDAILEKTGKSANEKLTGRELTVLADEIFEKSSIKLSINTLKRILGVIDYKGNPTLSTKDALAKYLGYLDWNDFLQKNFNITLLEYKKQQTKPTTTHFSRQSIFTGIILSTIIAVILFVWLYPKQKQIQQAPINLIDTSAISLHVTPKQGLTPFEFFVEYQIDTALVHQDTLTLILERQGFFPMTKAEEKFFFTYLFPGKYNIDIQQAGQTLTRETVFAKTDGWMGMVYREPNTIYSYKLSEKEGFMSFPDSIIKHLEQHGERYYITFNHYKNFDVSGDSIRIKTRYRNTGGKFMSKTGNMFVNLFCEQGEIKNSFVNTGMLRYLKPVYSEQRPDFLSHDLSPFEKEDLEWIEAEIRIQNQEVQIFRSDSLIFSIQYEKPLGNLYGIQYFFVGNGEVDYFYLWDERDSLIIGDDFD